MSEKRKKGRPPNEGKDELKEILYERLEHHLRTCEIPHISIFISQNLDLILEYGYESAKLFLYDNEDFSTLLKAAKHKRIGTMLEGIVNGTKNVTGCIFALKQDGFRDYQEHAVVKKNYSKKDLKEKTLDELREEIRLRTK